MEKRETLDTIWEAPDELWEMIELLIFEMDPPKATGSYDRKWCMERMREVAYPAG